MLCCLGLGRHWWDSFVHDTTTAATALWRDFPDLAHMAIGMVTQTSSHDIAHHDQIHWSMGYMWHSKLSAFLFTSYLIANLAGHRPILHT